MSLQNSFNNVIYTGVGGIKFKDIPGINAAGDVFYLNSNNELVRLPVGTPGQVLISASGVPTWVTGVAPSGNAGGDLFNSYPNPTIAANAVSFAKMQNVSTSTFLGRVTAATGLVESLSVVQAQTLLNLGTAALAATGVSSGNVPVLDGTGKLNPAIIPSTAITSISVVASVAAMLALTIDPGDGAKVVNSGDPSENATFILQALPASTFGNWIRISDQSIDGAEIVTGVITGDRLGGGSVNAAAVLTRSGWALQVSGALPWITVATTTQQAGVNVGYLTNNVGKVTVTLPAVAAVGDRVLIAGIAAGGWLVAQNAGQVIRYLNKTTTAGITGRIDTQLPTVGIVDPYATIQLLCTVANTNWHVFDSTGSVDVV